MDHSPKGWNRPRVVRELPSDRTVWFISDLHLGDGTPSDAFLGKDAQLVALLERAELEDVMVVVNGDAIDFPQAWGFMRVLRACYRARSKKVEEARTVLRSVVPVPSLYYNIACTHALLGEKELALDYLERDLDENHPTAGARRQKLEWTRKDPDLASLRGEPRYERMVGAER